jgi:shikimate dehydrogenase
MAATRAAVLGSPIAHSLSPVLHTAGYRELGLTDWSYQAIECDEAGLPDLLGSLDPSYAGLSLTMPLKRAVLPLLDRTQPLAAEVGAANTVLLAGDQPDGGARSGVGQRAGYNTDVPGMVAALLADGVAADGNVLVLGGGATACSALGALRETGARRIVAAVRSRPRAQTLLAVAGRLGLAVELTGFGPELAGTCWPLIISTVPAAGAAPVVSLIEAGAIAADAIFDVIYDPWPTPLAAAAAAASVPVIAGYELLVQQAVGQFELMTGQPAPIEAMRAAGLAELDRRQAGTSRNNR